jgi:hypothetical protein
MTLDQIKGFSNSVSTWIINGMKTATDEQRAERYAICQACPNFDQRVFGGHGVCKICGCNMRTKTVFPHEKCPIDKWGKV